MENTKEIKITPKTIISFMLLLSIIAPMFFHGMYPILALYDVLLFLLILFVLGTYQKEKILGMIFQHNPIIFISIGLYFLTIIISAIAKRVPVTAFLFNLQLSVTFFIFWLMCAVYLDDHYLLKIKNCSLFFSHVNFIFVLIEYFILGYKQDLLGGIFGIYVGSNTLANVFMCIVCTVALQKYLNKRLSVSQLIVIFIENLLFAAFSEVKVFFVEFVLIIVLSVLFNRFSFKTLIIVVVSMLIIIIAIKTFYDIFPYYNNVFTINGIIDSFNNAYSSNRGLTRGTGISYIQNNFLLTPFDKWFGIGFGNAVFTSLSYVPNSFYQAYGYLKYNWFAHLYKFLETGWLGLLSFASFFIVNIFTKSKNKENLNISRILGILCIIFLMYDTALMNPYTMYVIACFLAMPYVNEKL